METGEIWEEDSLEVRRSRVRNEGSSIESSAAATATATATDSQANSAQLKGIGSKTNGHVINPSESMIVQYVGQESVLDESKEKHGPEDALASVGNGGIRKETEITEAKTNNSVYYDKDEEYIRQNHGDDALDITAVNISDQKNLNSVVYHEQEGIQKNVNLSITQYSEISPAECVTSSSSSKVTEIETVGIDLADESDLEGAELDVERVLQKQKTHDLYCPNCNSCITRRVILRKRKRRIRINSEDVKRNKLEIVTDAKGKDIDNQTTSGQVPGTGNIHLDGTSELAANEYDCQREPDIFRCLSCFSIFIPTGKGFKLFRIFGDKGKKTMEDQMIPSTILSDKDRTIAQSGSGDTQKTSSRDNVPLSNFNNIHPTAEVESDGDKASPSTVQQQLMSCAGNASYDANMRKDAGDNVRNPLDVSSENQPIASNVSNGMAYFQGDQSAVASINGTPAPKGDSQNDPISVYQLDGLKLLISTDLVSPTQENLQEDQKPDLKIQNIHADGAHSYEPPQRTTGKKKVEIHGGERLKIDKDTLVLSINEPILIHDKLADTVKDLKKMTIKQHADKDTVIVVEAGTSKPADSQLLQDLDASAELGTSPHLTTDIDVVERMGAVGVEDYEIEIIKSIVYGGLVESITSLGVVSSAAGGGTATLNILALSMANLIGGLVLVSHNLWELKKYHVLEVPNQQTRNIDRYKELLGRRENFVVHATVAVLSFIVFGLISPITYAFSFQKSDDRDFKLFAAAAASLLCIVLLGTGKAYVRKPPKSYFKTVGYYVLLGFAASGISCAAGELIKRLLEKFHVLPSNSPFPISSTHMPPDTSLWASY